MSAFEIFRLLLTCYRHRARDMCYRMETADSDLLQTSTVRVLTLSCFVPLLVK